MHNEIITLRHNDTSIAFDTSAVMWSLTDLWRAAGSPQGKEVWRWTETEQAKEYLQTLKRNLVSGEVSPDLVSGEVAIIVTRRGGAGSGGGTWAHQLAGLEYARYLSPELSIACNQFILDYWRGKQEHPAPHWEALEQRIAALEQANRLAAEDTITITISLTSRQRLEVIRELGGAVSPKQLYTELKQRGHNVSYHKVLRWLHSLAKRDRLKHHQRGRYELHDQ